MDLALLTYTYFTLLSLKAPLIILVTTYVVIILSLVSVAYFKWETSKEKNKETKLLTDVIKELNLPKIIKPKLAIFILFFALLIPSKDTMQWVIGAYVTENTVEAIKGNEEFQKLPTNVLKAANAFLEEATDKGK